MLRHWMLTCWLLSGLNLALIPGPQGSRKQFHVHAKRQLETATNLVPIQPQIPEWVKTVSRPCLPMMKKLNQNKTVIVDIAVDGNQDDWSCAAEIISKNPNSDAGAVKYTAPCLNRSNEWNSREDSVNLLALKTIPKNQKLLKAMTLLIFFILQMTMLALGCEILISEVKKHANKPIGAIVALVAQFGVMPLGAFTICRLLKLDFYPSIALIICGCCPGGNLSNLLAYGARGDMNLSILMTTCSSIGGLAAMPIMIFLYGGWTKAIFTSDPATADAELIIFGGVDFLNLI